MLNYLVIMGRLVYDPSVKENDGDIYARYRLACERDYTNNGTVEVDYIDCLSYGNRALWAAKYLKKGIKIVASGRIITGQYTDKDSGKMVKTFTLKVDNHYFADKKNNTNNLKEEYSNVEQEADSDDFKEEK